MYCLKCNKEVTGFEREQVETLRVKGEPIEITARVGVCSCCGEELWDETLEDRNLLEAYAKYRSRHGLLQPSEIRSIRERYGVTQRVFARILGAGDKTITRYENGSIADVSMNNLMMLSRDPENFRLLLEGARERLTEQEYDDAMQVLEQETQREKRKADVIVVSIPYQMSDWSGVTNIRF